MYDYDLVVIGGGAAGMAAALSAEKASSRSRRILLVDRNPYLGGILPQCIHHGFGLGYFREDLTGPEYAARFISRMYDSSVEIQLDTTVLSVKEDHSLILSGKEYGYHQVSAEKLIVAAGCRERPIGALPVAGSRPSGIFTAGAAQKMVNIGHYDLGNEILILGSGDIGLIMARRFTLLGKHVLAVIEQKDRCGGLQRNQENCIRAFDIPLFTDTTVRRIEGMPRITGVVIENLITKEERYLACDTLITSVGLIPEQDLITDLYDAQGSLPLWISLCGNCDYVHEIVDSVTVQAEKTGGNIFQ